MSNLKTQKMENEVLRMKNTRKNGNRYNAIKINGWLVDLNMKISDYHQLCMGIRNIFITHEHKDHFNKQIFKIAMAGNKKVYMTRFTKDKIIEMYSKEEDIIFDMMIDMVILVDIETEYIITSICNEDYNYKSVIKIFEFEHGNTKSFGIKVKDNKVNHDNEEIDYRSWGLATDLNTSINSGFESKIQIIPDEMLDTELLLLECAYDDKIGNSKILAKKHYSKEAFDLVQHDNKIAIHNATLKDLS